jgi:hypothetical protein
MEPRVSPRRFYVRIKKSFAGSASTTLEGSSPKLSVPFPMQRYGAALYFTDFQITDRQNADIQIAAISFTDFQIADRQNADIQISDTALSTLHQGCQMAYFQTKIPNLGIFCGSYN